MEQKRPAVYIMANKPNGTLYVGVTSSLIKRVWQHKQEIIEGFTKKYGCKTLVWFELHDIMESAIMHEKQLKAGSRAAKIRLILSRNPDWQDLYTSIIQ